MKKVANFLAALAFVGLSGSANAQITVIDSGTCGADLAWKLTSDSTLTISGNGDMTDYNYWRFVGPWDIDTSDTPWWSHKDNIAIIVIGDSVTNIGDGAFGGCIYLTSVTIPNSITSIGNCSFRDCISLISVIVGNSVTHIGHEVFYRCENLMSVTIPNNVTSIGIRAFYDCSSLTSVTIPDGVTIIEDGTFFNCLYLDSVTIGNNVVSIGEMAFALCSRLRTITIHATTPPVIYMGAVSYVPDTIPIYIPCGTLSAYQQSEWGDYFSNFIDSCTGLNEVVYNENVTVYPNPTTGKFSVVSSQLSEMTGEVEIEIFDVVGRKYDVGAKNILPDDEIEIDISHLASGIYFVKINGITKKITKK